MSNQFISQEEELSERRLKVQTVTAAEWKIVHLLT